MNQNQAKRELIKCKMILEDNSLNEFQRMAIEQYLCSILNEFEVTGLNKKNWELLEMIIINTKEVI